MKHPDWNRNTLALITVAALGNFVDVYDLLLFSVIRVSSLKSIGVAEQDLMPVGAMLMNWQMTGMLLGGILWGVLGDKKGRLKVLFASIITYSIANIINGLISNVTAYAIVRFLAGVGLAGELGAGITLVTETMSKKNRGYGTMIVASIGLLGAVVAAQVGGIFHWRTSYFIGGGMGLVLLLLRIGVMESEVFSKLKHENNSHVKKGSLMMIFGNRERFFRYLNCTLIALPQWFVVGILVTFAPEFGKALNASEPLVAGTGIMFTYLGISLGDILTGMLSQLLKTRKKIVIAFIILTYIGILTYLFSNQITQAQFVGICFFLGIGTGFWVIFITIAAEQFGTNLRATVATTVPNFIRGSLVLVTWAFLTLKPSLGIVNAALVVGSAAVGISLIAAFNVKETYGKDLDFLEH